MNVRILDVLTFDCTASRVSAKRAQQHVSFNMHTALKSPFIMQYKWAWNLADSNHGIADTEKYTYTLYLYSSRAKTYKFRFYYYHHWEESTVRCVVRARFEELLNKRNKLRNSIELTFRVQRSTSKHCLHELSFLSYHTHRQTHTCSFICELINISNVGDLCNVSAVMPPPLRSKCGVYTCIRIYVCTYKWIDWQKWLNEDEKTMK